MTDRRQNCAVVTPGNIANFVKVNIKSFRAHTRIMRKTILK
jgi:hypothetical protein